MTVQLDWPSDVVDRLTDEARKKGLSLDAYVLQTVLQQEGSNGAPSDDAEQRRRRAEAGARILEQGGSAIDAGIAANAAISR